MAMSRFLWKRSPFKTGYEWQRVFNENGDVVGVRICKRVYVCLPGRRLIFRDGVYEGWYKP